MCLATPMKLVELRSDGSGIADQDGVTYVVNLSLIADPRIGDFVIVHAGFAIEKLDPEEAESRIRLFEELAHTLADGAADALR